MARRVPRLYRLSGVLRGIGTLIIVILVVYLVTAIYSAAQLAGNGGDHGGSTHATLLANGTALVVTTVNLSNPGYFAINDLSVSLQVRDPAGALLAVGGANSVTIPARGNGSIPVSIWISLGGTAATLVTNDAELTDHIWLNASYASLFNLHIAVSSNYTWGAPLYGLNATAQTPSMLSNGTIQVPVAVSFQNHAGFADSGRVAFSVVSATGTTCGVGTLAVNAAAGTMFAQTLDVFLTSGCNPSGGQVLANYSGNGLSYAFPAEPIP